MADKRRDVFVRGVGQDNIPCLYPADAMTEEKLAKMKLNTELAVEITRPRNLKFHNKFFGMLAKIHPHVDDKLFPTEQALLDSLKILAGWTTRIWLPDRQKWGLIPKSISFAKMTQDEFDEFYNVAVRIISEKILPGMDKKLIDEIVEMA